MEQFDKKNFHSLCDELAERDKELQWIISNYHYPPFWVRPNTFATLVLTILEQQVSIASAFAAFKKLKEKVGAVSPHKLLCLSDEALRSCYFSRQKIVYVRALATAIVNQQINLKKFYNQPDDMVRTELKKLKGIGEWTADIYLLHALRRLDIFPVGDLALVNALKEVKQLAPTIKREELMQLSLKWKPYRSIATMILWHCYIQKRGIKLI
ncbi:MAG: DNA-3-methyladenine glycosylase 2 family protein [Flavisolibacter sp.]|nr:DNA-3-methyladenine glycosylase 2 family protein [Flavisolibacter sp.]